MLITYAAVLDRWLKHVDDSSEIHAAVLDVLAKKKELNSVRYSICIIMLEGMAIRKELSYGRSLQRMAGFANLVPEKRAKTLQRRPS